MVYNEAKTKCMCFKPKSLRNLHIASLFLNGTKLTFVENVKYLGVLIQDTLDDQNDMARHRKYLYGKGNLLIKNFLCCSEEVKLRLFKTYCNNIYGGHLWSHYRPTDKQKIVAFNDTCRLLFEVHSHRGTSTCTSPT